ncbi:hypothetical protein HN388_01465 [bacterium]|nr:hypothetical protein [bacterium]MBT7311128.1 hypothetical protein [bacterium]
MKVNPMNDQNNNSNLQAEPVVCFHGSYQRAVDGRGRFNLPFRFRKGGGTTEDEQYVVSRGPDGNLTIFPRDEWVRAFNKIKRQSPNADWRARVREISHDSADITPDAQGRVLVSQELFKSIGVAKKVLVVGMGHYMELWSPEKYESGQKDLSAPDPEFLDQFFF